MMIPSSATATQTYQSNEERKKIKRRKKVKNKKRKKNMLTSSWKLGSPSLLVLNVNTRLAFAHVHTPAIIQSKSCVCFSSSFFLSHVCS